jgi:ABC-2 type transport system ATP-binding protein
MTLPVVLVKGLTRRFGTFVAVDHVSFEINPGEIVGYLGPNGSGKTTTIRLLLGLLRPSEGSASVLGFDCARQTDQIRTRAGYMSQKFAIYDDLSVWENMSFYGGVYGVRDKKKILETIAQVGLLERQSVVTRDLSAGWRQRLALGIALVHHPRLLFLDEPTSGVDPNARRAFWDLIYALAAQGVTILVTTHYMDEAEYCHRVGIMRSGKLLAMDTPGTLKAQFVQGQVYEVYADPLMGGLRALQALPGVLHTGLAGDHVRVVAAPSLNEADLTGALTHMRVSAIQKGEPSLEDVFQHLAGG